MKIHLIPILIAIFLLPVSEATLMGQETTPAATCPVDPKFSRNAYLLEMKQGIEKSKAQLLELFQEYNRRPVIDPTRHLKIEVLSATVNAKEILYVKFAGSPYLECEQVRVALRDVMQSEIVGFNELGRLNSVIEQTITP